MPYRLATLQDAVLTIKNKEVVYDALNQPIACLHSKTLSMVRSSCLTTTPSAQQSLVSILAVSCVTPLCWKAFPCIPLTHTCTQS